MEKKNKIIRIIIMWEKIKRILQKEGGKCIIIEKGQPTYLVMKVDDYEIDSKNNISSEIEKVNRDIDEMSLREKEESEVIEPNNREEVKVEDLPF